MRAERFDNCEWFYRKYQRRFRVAKIMRISRCHRQGQQFDVIVVNFINRNNFADVRLLELINKRLLQFDGIIGLSDDVIGNFCNEDEIFEKALKTMRTKAEIQETFENVLNEHKQENKQLVKTAEQSLFSTFNGDITDKVTVTPQYIKDRIEQINNDLWRLTKYFFKGKEGYICVEDTRTLKIGIRPQKVFTGTHLGRREYSIDDRTLPKSGWHTVTGNLAGNVIHEIFWKGIPDKGSIVVDAEIEKCRIGYYDIKIKKKGSWSYFNSWNYHVFVGKTLDERIMNHEECIDIMELPVTRFTADSETYGDRDGISKTKNIHELDRLIETDKYIELTVSETDRAIKEEIEQIKATAKDKKIDLERKIEELRNDMRKQQSRLSQANSVIEKIQAEKRKVTTQKELKQREQQLFLDGMRLDVAMENQIKEMTDKAQLLVEVKRHFIINVEGN